MLGTVPKSAPHEGTPVRSESPPAMETNGENGGKGLWGAPVFKQDDSRQGSGSSTPSADIPSSQPPKKKKSGSKFSLSSLMGALDVSGSSTPKTEHDHLLMADQLASPVDGRKRAQSVGMQYAPKPEVEKALGKWRFADEEIDVAEVRPLPIPFEPDASAASADVEDVRNAQDTNFVFLDPDHPRSIAQRRKHFCVDNGKHRKEFVYDPDM